jgi:eukaryotic-like serine/threonine-protein kinase
MADVIEARWQRLSELIDQALGLTEPERAQWLAALEQQDPDMAAQVMRTLAVREQVGYSDFLAAPLSIRDELPATASLAGRVVGPYNLEVEIGRGGMGSVWSSRR